ncbi:MAG TPA: Rid family detoxifying hydrolase, partial [Burkholderiales bacterium]|nr:Rid family detoxifying hydrolase [Burkholderiales bacterium]
PEAIGPYSQAISAGNFVFLSGQIGIDPKTQELSEGIDAQLEQVFDNLEAVAKAAGGDLASIVKINIYLTTLDYFLHVNDVMEKRFSKPFPARATLGVSSLPRGAMIEVDAIMNLS